jgi:hypothetical protein
MCSGCMSSSQGASKDLNAKPFDATGTNPALGHGQIASGEGSLDGSTIGSKKYDGGGVQPVGVKNQAPGAATSQNNGANAAEKDGAGS